MQIRKYEYPTTKVYYKNVHIGDIENEHEFLMFRADMIENPEHELYRLETPRGVTVLIDKFGRHEYVEELEEMNSFLSAIIEKQISYRIRLDEEKKD